jgi:predicted alpha/beta-hydrolase family hydrolase
MRNNDRVNNMKPDETQVNYPPYWITSIEDVKRYLEKNAVKGKFSIAGHSAGGREIFLYEYGEKEDRKGYRTERDKREQSDTPGKK